MKKVIITLASFFLMITAFAETPGEKVLQLFNATFSSPQEVTWYDTPDYYAVSFVQNGINTRVKYDKEGNFMSSIRYYGKQHLPINILSAVSKEFVGFEIYGITEVTNTSNISYQITFQDERNFITAKVSSNGSISKVNKFTKA